MRQSPIRDLHRPDKSSGIPTRRPMNDVSCILRQPDYLASNSRSDHWIEFAQLRTCLRAYFDSVGHETRRGFHALNFPAKSWRRASRSSAMIFGFCDVNQSKSSSRFCTDESTGREFRQFPSASHQRIDLNSKRKCRWPLLPDF